MEYWNDGSKGRKTIDMISSAFGAHYSTIPTFPGPDLTYKVGVLWTSLTRYHSDNGFFEPSSARAGHHSMSERKG